jgi:hypothetical protein
MSAPCAVSRVITKSGNGTWQYSTDNANWTDFGAVSSTSALLLGSTTYIRYVPDGANGETASLTFRAWVTTGSASVNGIPALPIPAATVAPRRSPPSRR